MEQTLKKFTNDTLFNATSALLDKLHIQFDRETAEPIDVADLYDQPMPLYLREALTQIDSTYFIGIVNDGSLQGRRDGDSLSSVADTMQHGGKYDGMFIFACDAKQDANLTRTAASALTRAFNRIASANPVILIIRQGHLLSLATCERTNYQQVWRQGSGEKLGKVNILRNIDCKNTHRGHIDILESLGDKAYPTFEELYKHWLDEFSSELLTKKFYNELSDWYAWAVQVVKFPNDLRTTEDDARFNHESCIRLITRLIFVWFLKQKKLIPDEFFDEKYIRENLIDEFDPHNRKTLLYDAEKSKYYRLILQNLFFAMLNCPIVAEGKDTPNNRRFRSKMNGGRMNWDYNVNNLMRYEGDFMEGGANKFKKLANTNVPFLNGGLFDCLDDKPRKLYYDGFSERENSLAQLYFPDYLFFGDEVGKGIDLSQWYDDKKKKSVSARGIIDILKRYSFTIEENTPLDQEVSLDPELLGKVFENLLASFNPETKTSARKQTGSFYTPREIVQYMVDESLVAHLKRMCGDELEPQYRALVSYATDEVELTAEQRKSIMNALYNCRVLDPACGSGAFPMGVLQQMVHILKRIDPTNEMWNQMMVDIAIEDARKELQKVSSGSAAEKAKIEENRKARLDDIESAFNQSINDPDYARKLYLIEHCIYGVDIQPIATQISKLRFFISLVVDQKPTNDAKNNFGIRPLPNLEAKFVTANTLIPLDRSRDLFTSSKDIREYEEQLHELNHRIFLAKRNKDKEELRHLMMDTRRMMALTMEKEGFIGQDGFTQLMAWNMFDQNASASFFDPEWMFGVKEGFDVVIANPPYFVIDAKNKDKTTYEHTYPHLKSGRINIYQLFLGLAENYTNEHGIVTYIHPKTLLGDAYLSATRQYLLKKFRQVTILNIENRRDVFENVLQAVIVSIWIKADTSGRYKVAVINKKSDIINLKFINLSKDQFVTEDGKLVVLSNIDYYSLLNKINQAHSYRLKFKTGSTEWNKLKEVLTGDISRAKARLLFGENIQRYSRAESTTKRREVSYILNKGCLPILDCPAIITQRTTASEQKWRIIATLVNPDDEPLDIVTENSTNVHIVKSYNDGLYELGVLESKLMDFYFRIFNSNTHVSSGELNTLPIAKESCYKNNVIEITRKLVFGANVLPLQQIEKYQKDLNIAVAKIYSLTYDEVLITDPETPITREQYESFE